MADIDGRTEAFQRALLLVDRLAAQRIVAEALTDLSPVQVIEQLLSPALEHIGTGWDQGIVALSQIYMSGRLCEDLADDLLPPGNPGRKEQPKTAIATLEDFHLLGKRMVQIILRGGGYTISDYGRMMTDSLVQRAQEDGIQVLLISTLMLSSALHIKQVTEKLHHHCPEIKIVVGGAPFRFDDQLWQEVGSDAYGRTASEALEILTRFDGGLT